VGWRTRTYEIKSNMTRTRRVSLVPWLVLITTSRFRGDHLFNEKKIGLGISVFFIKVPEFSRTL
jgi:hypothetical protein